MHEIIVVLSTVKAQLLQQRQFTITTYTSTLIRMLCSHIQRTLTFDTLPRTSDHIAYNSTWSDLSQSFTCQ